MSADGIIDPTRAEREVLQLEREIYDQPTLRHDVADHLSEDFWEVSEHGHIVDKATLLSNLARSPLLVDDYPIDETRVQVFGNVAISTGRSVLKARILQADGTERPLVRSTRFVHVWVHDGGVWQTVYAHNSTAPEPPSDS